MRYSFAIDSLNLPESRLDSCIVSIYPSLNPDHEALTLPEGRLQQFGIIAKVSKDGASITGSEFIQNYELVIFFLFYSCYPQISLNYFLSNPEI